MTCRDAAREKNFSRESQELQALSQELESRRMRLWFNIVHLQEEQ